MHPPLSHLHPQGHLAVVRELLADAGRRSCLKSLSKDGSTALHVAAAAGQAEVVQLMLDAGARTDARDRVSGVCWGPQPHGTVRTAQFKAVKLCACH